MPKKKTGKFFTPSDKFRLALLAIGSQHPANGQPGDLLVELFNRITADAREAVGAKGKSDDAKADWCADESDKMTSEPPDALSVCSTKYVGGICIDKFKDGHLEISTTHNGGYVVQTYTGKTRPAALRLFVKHLKEKEEAKAKR